MATYSPTKAPTLKSGQLLVTTRVSPVVTADASRDFTRICGQRRQPSLLSPPNPCLSINTVQRVVAFHPAIISTPERTRRTAMAAVAPGGIKEVLPPVLTSTSHPPPLFDGTTRLYISYICPYAQRAWIARNYKGLQEKIKLVAIDLQNRPAWYKEKVYPGNKVPSLEHNNEVKGESLDLIKYIDEHFEGPALLPDDSSKQQFAEELLSYSDSFNKAMYTGFTSGDVENENGAALDKIENALSKFDDGPFFLGQFSLVDIAYAPFIERFQTFLSDVKNFDITKGRPKLALWIEELNKIDAYSQTRQDPQELLTLTKKRLGIA